jgi:hypothetical protein
MYHQNQGFHHPLGGGGSNGGCAAATKLLNWIPIDGERTGGWGFGFFCRLLAKPQWVPVRSVFLKDHGKRGH